MPRARVASAPTPLAGQRLANTEAPGQPYGAAADERAAQNVVPLRPADAPPQGTPAPQSAPQPAPSAQRPFVAPGSLPYIEQPTTRPQEPVTAGIDYGPGPGSEAMGQGPSAARTLNDLALTSHSSVIADLASAAMALGL